MERDEYKKITIDTIMEALHLLRKRIELECSVVPEPVKEPEPEPVKEYERISADQLANLHMLLEEHPFTTKDIMSALKITTLAEMPRDSYERHVRWISAHKIKLLNQPKSQW